MPISIEEIKPFLPSFNEELLEVIAASGLIKDLPAGMEILNDTHRFGRIGKSFYQH